MDELPMLEEMIGVQDNVLIDDEIVVSRCSKLNIQEHFLAYYQNRDLNRNIKTIECDQRVVENVMLNYLLMKNIVSHLSWQDKIICKHVCKTWQAAVQALEREQHGPDDFVLNHHSSTSIRNGFKFTKSCRFFSRPMAVFVFANAGGFSSSSKCKTIFPNPCTPPCRREHNLLNVIHSHIDTPEDCILTIKANYLSYMPVQNSTTYEHLNTFHMFRSLSPYICGVNIPMIQGVEFHIVNIKADSIIRKEFHETVNKLSETRIFKGLLVFVTEKFILDGIDDIIFLNHIQKVQPDIPYALGGCIVEDTTFEQNDIDHIITGINFNNEYITENMVTITMFTVPKNISADEDKTNFSMYSVIIEACQWTKPKIQEVIKKFSKRVPQFEHSVAFKLSCVGRDEKHKVEQDYFRDFFPNTRILGCYGNGELGINNPSNDSKNTEFRYTAENSKRFRSFSDSEELLYSYSTVFVYMGWGKITWSPESQ